MLKHKIRDLREAAGMSKATLARAVGVTDVTVGYWESGAIKNIGADKLIKLANTFGLSVSDLLDDPLRDKPGLEWALSVSEEKVSQVTIANSIKARLEKMK